MSHSLNLLYKFCDPIHGFIRVDEFEKSVIDSPAFQRLRYISQMGVAYLLYPGATHKRFEHSLGVMELASRIYDALLSSHPEAPLSSQLSMDPELITYFRRVLRFAALVHDLGHLPFSHTGESEVLGKSGHELMTKRIMASKLFSKQMAQFSYPSRSLEQDVLKLVAGEKGGYHLTPFEKILAQVIADDHFGADRIDYLLRDSHYTGVKFGQLDYHQLIDKLRIIPKGDEWVIGIAESGLQSVESLWMARYLMFSRVYHHPKSRIYSMHMARFLLRYFSKKGFPIDLEAFLEECDFSILTQLQQEAKGGNYDAAALLKKGAAYVQVPISADKNGLLSEKKEQLQKLFGDDLFIDCICSENKRDDMLLIKENREVSSVKQHSFFLREHPSLSGSISLYAKPERVTEILAQIE